MSDWWYGDRTAGFVRLVRCDQCQKSERVTVKPVGNIPRKCDKCRKKPWSEPTCAHCDELIIGRKRKYCAPMCRIAANEERNRLPENKAWREGNQILKTRDGSISDCIVCGEPVDPRVLSRWGYREYGMNAHESAGTHPDCESVDGPSCKDVLDKQGK